MLPLSERQTLSDISSNLGISKTTIHRIIKETKCLRPHSSSVKPTLTPDNEQERYLHCIRHVGNDGSYEPMNHIIHVDEKWFYMTNVNCKYYLAHDEEDPYRTTRHKGYIEKVMFLAAVGCPHYYYPENEHERAGLRQNGQPLFFDGKIGMWPIGRMVPAVRSSRYRERGTLVWENESVTRNKYREMMINLVLPSIKEKFPCHSVDVVVVQQDNSKSHIPMDDPATMAAIAALDLNLEFKNQPPNSPDLNICDLSFFRALQTMQLKQRSMTSEQLIQAVMTSFEAYQTTKLRDAFLTLQGCMNCILDIQGGNNYKIPHMGKRSLERRGLLPATLVASQQAIDFWMEPAIDNGEENENNNHENIENV